MSSIGTTEVDSDCLNGDNTVSKDYIAIPFAEVSTLNPQIYHSLFCGTILEDEEVSCKILSMIRLID